MTGPSPNSTIVVEFLTPAGEPLELSRLGPEFLEGQGIPQAQWERPFRVEVVARTSKAGNVYFEYQQASIPLPDGLDTGLRVEGCLLDAQDMRKSESGNPMRELRGQLSISGLSYTVTAFITQGHKPFWVKVHAQKGAVRKPGAAPQGGRIV
jgi:hypothetical protein